MIRSHMTEILRFYDFADLAGKCQFTHFLGSFWSIIKEGGPMMTPMNLFLLFWFSTLMPLFVKTDQEMKPHECEQTALSLIMSMKNKFIFVDIYQMVQSLKSLFNTLKQKSKMAGFPSFSDSSTPKSNRFFPIILQSRTMLHENRLSAFSIILFTDKRANKRNFCLRQR